MLKLELSRSKGLLRLKNLEIVPRFKIFLIKSLKQLNLEKATYLLLQSRLQSLELL